MKTYVSLFFFFLFIFLLTAGGRVASSDETAFFLEVQSLADHGTFAIPEGIVANGVHGPDGQLYVGGGIGYTLVSMPFYLLGNVITAVISLPPNMELLVHKAAFSVTNQFLCALLGVVFFSLSLLFGLSKRLAFAVTCILLFTTNLFPYAKSSMREPLLALCMVSAFYGLFACVRRVKSWYLHLSGLSLFLLINTKISMVVVLPVYAFYWLSIAGDASAGSSLWQRFRSREFWKSSLPLIFWVVSAVIVVGVVNFIEFGNVLSSGYSGKPQPFNTPLLTGLFGLLLSPGKSFFLYAPVAILVFWSWRAFKNDFPKEFRFIVLLSLVILLLHAKYFAWAGDGSWGPRYLIPMLPFALMIVGAGLHFGLEHNRKIFKFAAISLSLIGLIVQTGGLSVYYGSYLRYIGEFPYTKSFEDPEFLYKSHYVPEYSPVVGHWQLLTASIQKHLAGDMPSLAPEKAGERLPVSDASSLVHVIDYWFMYARYAGIGWGWIIAGLALQLAGVSGFALSCRRLILTEQPIVG